MSRPREIKKEILELHAEGFSYKQICEKLNCSKGTVAYHCGKGQKDKERNRGTKRRKENPLIKKINCFKEDKSKRPSAIKKKKNDNDKATKSDKRGCRRKGFYHQVEYKVEVELVMLIHLKLHINL